MRHLLRNSILCIGLMVFFTAMIFPPAQKLRLGKDLRGGVTLLYSVKIDRQESAGRVLDQVIQVLKDRIDPQGLLEIQMVAQGQDRIEITMPLPGPHVIELRDAYREKLNALSAFEITPDEFERAMRLETSAPDGSDPRAQALDRLSGGDEKIRALMATAAQSLDEARAARQALDVAKAQDGTPQDVIDDLVAKVADAEIAYEAARDEVLAASFSPEELGEALTLPTEEKLVRDDKLDEMVPLDSPRKQALDKIEAKHGDLKQQIEEVKQAYDVYVSNRKSLDDPEDLQRLISAAGVLSFRISIDPQGSSGTNTHPEEQRLRDELRELGPGGVRARDARWFQVNRIESWYETKQQWEILQANPEAFFASQGFVGEEYKGKYYILLWDVRGLRLTQADAVWGVRSAFESQDQLGRPAIGFTMNAQGAARLGELTGPNVGNNMAILLDDQIYGRPPVLRSRIASTGQISGDFSKPEREYLIRVLAAGSLQAKLSPTPLSINQIAPDLGADNLRAGMKAGIWALITVSAFMLLYYFMYGGVAVFSLLCNATLILGAMALARASFSLPGIAGVILTFGMAVDSNVLIYERIREELRAGQDLKTAVRLGFSRATSSIVDGNVTNLIVCFVLAYTGTQEIKGFAITLGIGVVATMFAALVVSRIIFALLVDQLRVKRMSMLPIAVPLIDRFLEPRINWVGLRWLFAVISLGYVSLGIGMIATRGERMLDTEFRGGVQIDLPLKEDEQTGQHLLRTRQQIQDAVRALGDQAPEDSPIRALRNAEIQPLNPEPDGVTSDTFRIKTYATDADAVRSAIFGLFGTEGEGIIDTRSPLRFRGQDTSNIVDSPVFPVISARLGESLGRPDIRDDVGGYIGGVAILLEDITPTPTLQGLEDRLEAMRRKEGYSQTLSRNHEVRVLAGTNDAVQSAVILVHDEDVNYFENESVWRADMRDLEWRLTRDALTEVTSLASVQSFSSIVASDFKGKAIVSVVLSLMLILIYIWVRFGNVRYSLAAIIALFHDVLTVIGLMALAEIIYDHEALQPVANFLGLEPFKIDLNIVAALLTIIGYSLNDTIIIMDRIRENRGKLSYADKGVVNSAINQTISRTVITSGTTLMAVLILYIFGGEGVHGFAFAMLVGIMVGTYSSVAVAAPLVWTRRPSGEGDRVEQPLSGGA
ncbi:MAG: protein translocase subunit SecD [Phycisphaerales bacterium]